MADLPNWVYDLVGDLITQREVHPILLFESGAFEGTRKYDWCPCTSLEKVPEDIQGKALAIRDYQREG